MCVKSQNILFAYLLSVLLLASSACDKISIPRLGFEDKPEPRLPITVTYAFSEQLVDYSHEVEACSLPYIIPVGEIITTTFLTVGQDRFNGVRAEPPIGQANGATLDGYRIIVNLNEFEFDPVTGKSEDERYHALLKLNLLAIYENSSGTAVAQTPLSYYETVSLWTPALTSQSSSCFAAAIDGAVEEAAETLAKEMISVMPRLAQSAQASPKLAQRTVAPAVPRETVSQALSPAVQFRTKLVDANHNLVLEEGEVIVLFIETTNVTNTDIPSAYIELRGTPVLVEAFKRVVSIPIPLGTLKAGKKRTAEIRGRVGRLQRQLTGELIVGVILSEGLPPGNHSIRAELHPRKAPRKP